MGRLAAIFGALSGLLLIPLALSGPTALLLLPAHLTFACLVCLGACIEGLAGRAERARLWGFGYLLATVAMVAALQVGAELRGSAMGYWGVPWVGALIWGWIPPLVSGAAGVVGQTRARRRSRKVVLRRKELRREAEGA